MVFDFDGSCGVLGDDAAGVAALGADAGGDGTGALEDETARVSRSMTFGRAVLPAKKSEADKDGSMEAAGGKILL